MLPIVNTTCVQLPPQFSYRSVFSWSGLGSIFQIIFKQVLRLLQQISPFSVSNTSKMYMGSKHCSVAVLNNVYTPHRQLSCLQTFAYEGTTKQLGTNSIVPDFTLSLKVVR